MGIGVRLATDTADDAHAAIIQPAVSCSADVIQPTIPATTSAIWPAAWYPAASAIWASARYHAASELWANARHIPGRAGLIALRCDYRTHSSKDCGCELVVDVLIR